MAVLAGVGARLERSFAATLKRVPFGDLVGSGGDGDLALVLKVLACDPFVAAL